MLLGVETGCAFVLSSLTSEEVRYTLTRRLCFMFMVLHIHSKDNTAPTLICFDRVDGGFHSGSINYQGMDVLMNGELSQRQRLLTAGTIFYSEFIIFCLGLLCRSVWDLQFGYGESRE